MYKVTSTLAGKVTRSKETATPFGTFVTMLANDKMAGKITPAQEASIVADVVHARRAGYPGTLDSGTGDRRYRISEVG